MPGALTSSSDSLDVQTWFRCHHFSSLRLLRTCVVGTLVQSLVQEDLWEIGVSQGQTLAKV